MKQPEKKPAVPGCSNWTSLELRLPKCRADPRRVVLAANRPEDHYYKRILVQWRGVKKLQEHLTTKNKTKDSLLLAMLARVLAMLARVLAMLARVLAMARCLSESVSVCHNSVFYRNGWIE